MTKSDFYTVLNVTPRATLAEIKEQFRFLAHAYHPDKFASEGHKRVAAETFKKINEAFQTLSNPNLRAEYDRQRAKSPNTAAPPPKSSATPPRSPQPPRPGARPPFPKPPPVVQRRQRSSLAVASMVWGILGFFSLGLTGIIAVICGHKARSQIKESGGTLSGGGFAIAGLITGYWSLLVPLSLLVSIGLPAMTGSSKSAKIAAAKTEITLLSSALASFKADNGYYPINGDLEALVDKPTYAPNWRGPYLDRIPFDPWGNPYDYECPGARNTDSYDLTSNGPDGIAGTDDDILNSPTESTGFSAPAKDLAEAVPAPTGTSTTRHKPAFDPSQPYGVVPSAEGATPKPNADSDLGVVPAPATGSFDPTSAKPIALYRSAANRGDALAQYYLGYYYSKGSYGFPKDLAESARWYRKSADQGYVWAQINLGYCYALGDGVSQDDAEAAKWFRKAAEQGNAQAECNLGLCYENGGGVAQDYVQAYMWATLAADQGLPKAKELVVELSRTMTVAQIVEAQRLTRDFHPVKETISQ